MSGTSLRPVALSDVDELVELTQANHDHLAPLSPPGLDAMLTVEGQREHVIEALRRRDADLAYPMVILDADSSIVGRINLNSITRGAAESASVGYWVARERTGRGIATAAVALALDVAFDVLGLHRVQAETLPDNRASQVVLQRNGFERIGYAPSFLHIGGDWRDHVLFQRVNTR